MVSQYPKPRFINSRIVILVVVSSSSGPRGRSEFSSRVQKIICLKSGRRCAFTGCNQDLCQHGSIVGIFAHIHPACPTNGPRFDPRFPKERLIHEDNCILLCGPHHKIVDDHPNEYTVERMEEMKRFHENFVSRQMIRDMSNVNFPEIDILLKQLENSPALSHPEDWRLISIGEKIDKNRLSDTVRDHIGFGLLKVQEVKKFIEAMDLSVPYYSDRIRQVFIDRYQHAKETDSDPDSIFCSLLSSIEGEHPDCGKHAAALAILTYLFERCEVFEK